MEVEIVHYGTGMEPLSAVEFREMLLLLTEITIQRCPTLELETLPPE